MSLFWQIKSSNSINSLLNYKATFNLPCREADFASLSLKTYHIYQFVDDIFGK